MIPWVSYFSRDYNLKSCYFRALNNLLCEQLQTSYKFKRLYKYLFKQLQRTTVNSCQSSTSRSFLILDLAESPVLRTGSWCQFPGWGACVYLKRHINGFDISPFTNMIQIKLSASTYPSLPRI